MSFDDDVREGARPSPTPDAGFRDTESRRAPLSVTKNTEDSQTFESRNSPVNIGPIVAPVMPLSRPDPSISAPVSVPDLPIRESPAGRANRDSAGRWITGNRANLRHGGYSRDAATVPELSEVAADVEAFRLAVIADQGDVSTIRAGYINRLAETELLVRLLGKDLADRGLLTKRGRVRSTFTAYLQACGRWDQTARQLGLERRPREVERQTLDQWRAATDTDTPTDSTPTDPEE